MNKTVRKLYFLFGSLMMMFPPLSFGLTMIYIESYEKMELALSGLVVNLVLIAILAIITLFLISQDKKKKPTLPDLKFIIFGLISNAIIFLFVFQNQLEITREVDIYVSTLAIVLCYLFLVNRKNVSFELLFLSIILLVFYRYHLYFIYETYNYPEPFVGVDTTLPLRLLYGSIPFIILGFSVHKFMKYKAFDWFTIIYSILGFSLILYPFDNASDALMRIFATTALILPFLMISDFIVMKINKNYTRNKILFYLRVNMLIIFGLILRGGHYFTLDTYSHEELFMYTYIMYATIFINVLEHFLGLKQKEAEKALTSKKVQEGVYFKEITLQNWVDCIELSVTEEQKHFVASNVLSLAQAKVNPEWTPLAIYKDDTMVGFAMYGLDEAIDYPWLIRLMIDERYQQQGIGRIALTKILALIESKYRRGRIYLSTEPENQVALEFYKKAGFINTGGIEDDELVHYIEM